MLVIPEKAWAEARWRPDGSAVLSVSLALAGNVGSVALVLTIKGASLLNRPCQTMQRPAESERWGHGLAVKPSGSYFLSMTTSINLSRPSSGSLPSAIPARRKKAKRTQAAGIKQRLDYPLNVSLSRTVHLWIPPWSGAESHHFFCCSCSQSFPFYPPPPFSSHTHALSARCPSFTLRGQIKFEIKSNPVASISSHSKIRHLTPYVTPPKTLPVTFIPLTPDEIQQ